MALIFYEKELPGNLRKTVDDLARDYAGKILIVTLARSDASEAMSRFQVRQLPALVTVRDNKPVARQENLQATDLKPYLAHLVGEGPLPAPRAADIRSSGRRHTWRAARDARRHRPRPCRLRPAAN